MRMTERYASFFRKLRTGCLLVLAVPFALIAFNVLHPLFSPIFVGANCVLPFTAEKEAELNSLIEQIEDSLVLSDSRSKGSDLTYLRKFTPEDQLYVIHNVLRKRGAILNRSYVIDFRGEGKDYHDAVYASYTYRISPYRVQSFLMMLDPYVQMAKWAGIGVRILVSSKPDDGSWSAARRIKEYPKIGTFTQTIFDPRGRPHTLTVNKNGNDCPKPIKELFIDK